MDTEEMVSFIDGQTERLTRPRARLTGSPVPQKRGFPGNQASLFPMQFFLSLLHRSGLRGHQFSQQFEQCPTTAQADLAA
jgi:hypothetical protein